MTVKEIHALAVECGIQNDLRGRDIVEKRLGKRKTDYEKLSVEQQKDYDKEKLTNPYPDSVILYDSGREVRKVMVGIDIGVGELLVAEKLGNIDLVISHHPLGHGLIDLSEVMNLQAEVFAQYGVPITVAQTLMEPRISEVSRGVNPTNHFRVPDAAKLLNMSLMCAHTVCDNMVANFLRKELTTNKFEYVSEVLKHLKDIPEYAHAQKQGCGPRVFAGNEKNFCGTIAITEITGGTEGTPEMYTRLSQAGVGTTIGMHMSEKHVNAAKKACINAVIAGHMSSDSVGINLFMDELEKRGIQVVPCSGVIRVSRNHN